MQSRALGVKKIPANPGGLCSTRSSSIFGHRVESHYRLWATWLNRLLAVTLLMGPVSLQAFREPDHAPLPNFDVRAKNHPAKPMPRDQQQAVATLKRQVPGLRIHFHPTTGAPRWIGSPRGFLSGPGARGRALPSAPTLPPGPGSPHRAIHTFVDQHQALFGFGSDTLRQSPLARAFTTPHNGMQTFVWQQQVDGIDVFDGRLVAHITRREELVSLANGFVGTVQRLKKGIPPGLNRQAQARLKTVEEAVAMAGKHFDLSFTPQAIERLPHRAGPPRPDQAGQFRIDQVDEQIRGRLVWLPESDDQLTLCWEIMLTPPAQGETYRLLLHGQTGQVLVRQCLTHYLTEATYRVFTSDSPTPFSPGFPVPTPQQPPIVARELLTLTALQTNASPLGWISDGTNETSGNNVQAQLDLNADNLPDLPRPQGVPFRVFDFPLDLNQPVNNYAKASVVQLFYWNNWMHDRLYDLGFTEEAGNFQTDNFGRGGQGNDPVLADAQDGSGINNANMTTFPDGTPGRMQMYVFVYATPERDGALDSEVVLHEYVHGLSNRRVGGGVGITARQSLGLGEGWSDFYALALLAEPGEDLHGNYAFGAYASYLLAGSEENYYFGIRRYPYTTDMARNPLTFKDIDPTQSSAHTGIPRNPGATGAADQVHRQGEVWASALWQARVNLIETHGFSIGQELVLQLVTDGMNLTPDNPTFLEARDGILLADQVSHGGANLEDLWAAFAKRGMGLSATAPASSTTIGVVEAFDVPDNLTITPASGFTGTGPEGGPFQPSEETFLLSNVSVNPLPWQASWSSDWITVSPANGTLESGASDIPMRVTFLPQAEFLASGIYQDTLVITNLDNGRIQKRDITLRVGQSDDYTEWFQELDNDLDFQSITFTPDGSASFYAACRTAAFAFPTDPTGGTRIPLSDDGFANLILSDGARVSLYGITNTMLFAGANGYLTLESGDTNFEPTLDTHFDQARISALFEDFDPTSGGDVSWKQLEDRVVVTYEDMPLFGSTTRNSFQVEWYFDGRITITWLNLDTGGGLAGLSPGNGVSTTFVESDLSQVYSCDYQISLSLPAQAREGDGLLAGQGSLQISRPAPDDLNIQLNASNPLELEVTPSLTLVAGETNILFDLGIIDDARVDGTQRINLTAQAGDYQPGIAAILVHDNETNQLFLSMADSAREGTPPISGLVQVERPVDSPVRIDLRSSDLSELTPYSQAYIPAGSSSTEVFFQVLDDLEIDGSQTVTVSAEVMHWASGQAMIQILDNENRQLSLSVPVLINEAGSNLSNLASVTLSGILNSNLPISLTTSPSGRLTTPPTLVIPAGQTSQAFEVRPIDNTEADGSIEIQLDATAAGWSGARGLIQVQDDETPPAARNPFPADSALDVGADTVLSWELVEPGLIEPGPTDFDIYLGVSPDLGQEHLLGTTTNLNWSPFLLAPMTTYYWQVVARRVLATPSPVWSFTTRGVDHFTWDPFPSQMRVRTSVPATLTAHDEFGSVVSNFTGQVFLSAEGGPRQVSSSLAISEVDPGTPDAMEFVNTTTEALDLSDWKISVYDNNSWPDPLLAYDLPDGIICPPGGVFRLIESGLFPGTYPNFYTGTNIAWLHGDFSSFIAVLVQDAQDQPIDFMCAVDAVPDQITSPLEIPLTQWNGDPVLAILDSALSHHREGSSDRNNSSDWEAAPPTRGFIDTNLALPFVDNIQDIAISPTTAGPFVDGVWSEKLRILEATPKLLLKAVDSEGHEGTSTPIQIAAFNDLVLNMVTAPNPVVQGSNLTCQVTVFNPGPQLATGLSLTNTIPDGTRLLSVGTSQGICGQDGAVVACDLDRLLANETATVTLLLEVLATGRLTNQAFIARSEQDADPANNQITVVTPAVATPLIDVSNEILLEGTIQTNLVEFKISLSTPVSHLVQLQFTTVNDSALANEDFAPRAGTLSFAPGIVQQTVAVEVIPDTLFEPNETFSLLLSQPNGALLKTNLGIALVLNDDVQPAFSVSPVLSIPEGNSGISNAVVEITLSSASGLPALVDYQTADNTAISGLDYEPDSGQIIIPPGSTNFSLNISIIGDQLYENDEQFSIILNDPINATIASDTGFVILENDDPAPSLVIRDATVREGGPGLTEALFQVSLSAPSGKDITLPYSISNGTAQAGSDFVDTSGPLIIPAGRTHDILRVKIIGDSDFETDEYFTLHFEPSSDVDMALTQVTGLILDDDAAPDQATQFVWATLPSLWRLDAPLPVMIQALDSMNRPATNYQGTARLQAYEGGPFSATVFTGVFPPQSNSFSATPMTVGYAFTPSTNLFLTHFRHFFGRKISLWNEQGTLLTSEEIVSDSGIWQETELAEPLLLHMGRRYRLGVLADREQIYWGAAESIRSELVSLDGSYSWNGDDFPFSIDPRGSFLADLRFRAGATRELSLSSSMAPTFTNGLWSGALQFYQPGQAVILSAQDRLGAPPDVSGDAGPLTIQPINDLSLESFVTPISIQPGQPATLTLVVSNTGPTEATGVQLTSLAPTATEVTLASASDDGTVRQTNNVWVAEWNRVPAQASVRLTLTLTADTGDLLLTNLAQVTRAELEPFQANNISQAEWKVLPSLYISGQPLDTSVVEGQTVLLSVEADALSDLSYQWYYQSLPLTGETNRLLSLPSISQSQAGAYLVEIMDDTRSIVSRSAQVSVAPRISPGASPVLTGQTLPPGYSLLTAPLPNNDNYVTDLLPAPVEGLSLFKAGAQGYRANNYLGSEWTDPTMTLLPGEGFFVKNPYSTNINLVFAGSYLGGNLTNRIPAGLVAGASIALRAGSLQSVLEYPAQEDDRVFLWDNGRMAYHSYGFAGGAWHPEEPSLDLGQGLWIQRNTSALWHQFFFTGINEIGYSVAPSATSYQTGQVNFLTFHPDPALGRVFHQDGVTPLGSNYFGQLHASFLPAPETVRPLGQPALFLPDTGMIRAGAVDVPGGFNGQRVWVQLKVWSVADGSSHAEARAAGGWTGQSALVPLTLGATTSGAYPGLPPPDMNLFPRFRLQGTNANQAPQLAIISDRLIHAGSSLSIAVAATDADTPPEFLKFSLTKGPPGANLNQNSGLLQWTSTSADLATTNLVTIRVSDDGLPPLTDETSFNIIVVERPNLAWIQMITGELHLEWASLSGTLYQVQHTADLTLGSWAPLTNIMGNDAFIRLENITISGPNRFYRIQVVP